MSNVEGIVPFGLRNGRMYAATEVANGLACDCLCPGCATPLVARQGEHRRPHFAHHAGAECQYGAESAIHRMAKQIIADHRRVLLPGWDGDLIHPNPSMLVDIKDRIHRADRVEIPARVAQLTDVTLEQRVGDHRPDLVVNDDQGELLIEIRWQHAVTPEKRQAMVESGRRMIEIDLSRLGVFDISRTDLLINAVLGNASNRKWISCPQAIAAWNENHRALCDRVQHENASIQEAREANLRKQRDRLAIQRNKRSHYLSELAALNQVTRPEAIQRRLQALARMDIPKAESLQREILPTWVTLHLTDPSSDCWAVNAHPKLWWSAAYLRFIQSAPTGTVVTTKAVFNWLELTFGFHPIAYCLFQAQRTYGIASQPGSRGRAPHWCAYFSDKENRAIPNLWRIAERFLNRLTDAGVLDRATDGFQIAI